MTIIIFKLVSFFIPLTLRVRVLVPKYTNKGPIVATSTFHLESLKGKSVIITGGAGGLGKAYAKAFVQAGAYVTIGDISEDAAKKIVEELGSNIQCVKCDVCNWEEQVSLFKTALLNSPHKNIDIVIANAGLGGVGDSLVHVDDPTGLPTKPDLHILDVKLKGVLYTTCLALHYFRRLQLRGDEQSDRCLIWKSSLSAYVDWDKSLQCPVSKVGVRGLMKCLRRSLWKDGIRINVAAPAYVDTGFIPSLFKAKMFEKSMEFAEVEDAVKAILKISTNTTVNGRSIGVLAQKRAPEGYIDLNSDDYSEDDFIYPFEQMALNLNL